MAVPKTKLGTAIFLSSLLVSLFSLAPLQAQPSNTTYQDELIAAADAKHLADERYWHLLLHYMPRYFGGIKSEADGKKFFFAVDGKTNSTAELKATLKAFFAPAVTPESGEEHPQCRFIGRYRWLKRQLQFDPLRLTEQTCERFDKWRASLDPDSMTLIFASYFLNNPASMYGHTLLRLNHAGAQGEHPLLDYAINYAANTGNDNTLLYSIYGLLGLYPGTFSNYPYYFKVQEYGNIHVRDLWEYRLNLTAAQLQPLLEHLWELGQTHFDYFFFDENCSYHLLSLIEIADPNLHLREHFRFFTAPADTVVAVYQQPGLVNSVHYRASGLSQLRQKLTMLTAAEKHAWQALSQHVDEAAYANSESFAPPRRALIVDAALDAWNLKQKTEELSPEKRRLLGWRSQLGESAPVTEKEFSTPPHIRHPSSRLSLGGGILNANDAVGFTELRWRGAYQDLEADDRGYLPGSQIDMGALALRWLPSEQEVHLESLTGVRIMSLAPLTLESKHPSWNVAFGVETLHHDLCADCNDAYLRGGPGITVSSRFLGAETYYFFSNLQLQYSNSFHDGLRFGPQAVGGVLFKWGNDATLHLNGFADWSPTTEIHANYGAQSVLRLSLTTNIELRLEGALRHSDQEAMGVLGVYY